MYCRKCGSLIEMSDQFCKTCGAAVSALEGSMDDSYDSNNLEDENQYTAVSHTPREYEQPMNHQHNAMTNTANTQYENAYQPMNNQFNGASQNMSSALTGMPQPMNNQFGTMPQSMDNQMYAMERPMSTTVPAGYINQNQNVWKNNLPQETQNDNQKVLIKYAIFGFIAVLLVASVIFGVNLIKGKITNPENPTAASVSTYKVDYEGYTLKIPTDLVYEKNEKGTLLIGNEEDTWGCSIYLIEYPYSKINTSTVTSNIQSKGAKVSNINKKEYGGIEFISGEVEFSGEKLILGYTKANAMYTFGVEVYSIDNDFNYDALVQIAKILSTAKYTGESKNLRPSSNIDLKHLLES